jgi:hypothetical protein
MTTKDAKSFLKHWPTLGLVVVCSMLVACLQTVVSGTVTTSIVIAALGVCAWAQARDAQRHARSRMANAKDSSVNLSEADARATPILRHA